MDRPLTRKEQWALRFHLLLCTACKRYRKQLMLLRVAMRKFADWMDEVSMPSDQRLSADARERIRRAISGGG
jgi:hypothetical protein